jgi:hypothetical protein
MTDLKEGNSMFIQFASVDYDVNKISFRGRDIVVFFEIGFCFILSFYCSKLRQS